MKRNLLTMLLVGLCTLTENAQATFIDDNGIYYNIIKKGRVAEVTSNPNGTYRGKITLPRTVVYDNVECVVNSIGEEAFKNCTGLTSITIPESVISIKSQAFAYCKNLESVVLPNGITELANSVFFDCEKLTSIVIPEGVTKIDGYAFQHCHALETIVLPESLVEIGNAALSHCYSIKYVNIPNSVTTIGSYAFDNGRALKTVIIGVGVSSMGRDVFAGCEKLNAILCLPLNPPSISENTFSETTFNLFVPSSALSAYSSAAYWSSLNSIQGMKSGICGETLKWSLFSHGELTFYGSGDMEDYTNDTPSPWSEFSDSIVYITLSDGITKIGDYAFYGCKNLKHVICQSTTPPSVSSNTFPNISPYIYVPSSALSAYQSANYWGEQSNLTGITHYGTCGNGQTWYLSNNGNLYIVGNGNMLDFGEGAAPWYEVRNLITSATIFNGITSIGDRAFKYCTKLKKLSIPEGVTRIGLAAASHCESLNAVTIPNSVRTIDNWAFDFTGLKVINVPRGVTSIGARVFEGCPRLTTVMLPQTILEIGNHAFANCEDLKDVYCSAETVSSVHSTAFDDSYPEYMNLHVSTTAVEYYKNTSPWSSFGTIYGIITSVRNIENEHLFCIIQPNHSKGTTSWAIQTGDSILKSNHDLRIDVKYDESDARQLFAFISNDMGETYYLYHPAEEMFVCKDGSLSPQPVDPIYFKEGAYNATFMNYFDNSHHINVGGSQQMLIDGWTTPDGGNSSIFLPVGRFDPTEALNALDIFDTGIENSQFTTHNSELIYDLQGRRIENPSKGIYIVDGKMVMIK